MHQSNTNPAIHKPTHTRPSFREAMQFWFKLGWISFGGTTGHIAIMHDYLVEKRKWISNSKFIHALNHCMILPGPEAQQLAIYIGWKLHGRKGGILAGTFFVLPSMLILLALSIIYVCYGNSPWLLAMFDGLKPAVLAIILVATQKVGSKALLQPVHFLVAGAAFFCTYVLHTPMPWIIVAVLALAVVLRFIAPSVLHLKKKETTGDQQEQDYYLNMAQPAHRSFKGSTALKLLLSFLLLWLIPFIMLLTLGGDKGFWKQLSCFFTETAFITIGGSYTVIPYVAQTVVGKLFWLNKTQMIDGFALAETTPGPLIIVLSYVGFMAGYNHFNGSLLMGAIGLLATTYFTFVPNFLFIFMGAPLIERSQGSITIQSMLSLVTATVVGVILNLTFFLGKDILFPAEVSPGSIDYLALGWVLVALLLQLKFRINVLHLVILSLLYGLLRYWLL
ncbi:chromate efflux transporter [Chitinophaga solisilvae]|uniref:chromate efflux transporter n=1 Tax=Chitinophaga solisilvae TaxID=1233460 RepID=UPI001372131F|nr:chromate efflux transporter [Chitinophaga solisilvae]